MKDDGMKITKLETFTKRRIGFVRVHTTNGDTGIGQLSPYNADIAATVFHRQIAPRALGCDLLDIEDVVDDIIRSQYKFPWSYVCRAACGLDTALWDLRGKRQGKPVVSLLGGEPTAVPAYGSSMRRDIEPEDEADRLATLRDEDGYDAFKIRIGGSDSLGDDDDEWPGRSERVVPTVRDAVGEDVDLYVDANGAYTPERAIEIGRDVLKPNDVVHYEEPCPFWELEQTAAVTDALGLPVTGGEQDNVLAQWRRMIETEAVDVIQPDVCYIGGLSRAKQVADLAADAGLPCVPHSANYSLVTVFALHLLGAIDNGGRLEFSIEDHWAEGLYTPELTVEDGAVQIPSSPGWGVDLDAEWLATAQYEVSEA